MTSASPRPLVLWVVCALTVVFTGSGIGQVTAKRYVTIPSTEAEQLVRAALEREEIPSPSFPLRGLRLVRTPRPDGGFSGVRIQDSGYFVFGHVDADFVRAAPQANLSAEFPELTKFARYDRGAEYLEFLRNAVCYASVDVQVTDRPMFQLIDQQWRPVKELRKGGYVWHLGPTGIVLEGKEDVLLYVPLRGKTDFEGFIQKPLVYMIHVTPSGDESRPGILIDPPGEPLVLR